MTTYANQLSGINEDLNKLNFKKEKPVPKTKNTKTVKGNDRILMQPHFELRKDADTEKWNWVFWSANHRALAANVQPYDRRNDAERAVKKFRDETGCAKIFVGSK